MIALHRNTVDTLNARPCVQMIGASLSNDIAVAYSDKIQSCKKTHMRMTFSVVAASRPVVMNDNPKSLPLCNPSWRTEGQSTFLYVPLSYRLALGLAPYDRYAISEEKPQEVNSSDT